MTAAGTALPERVAAEIRSLRKGRGLQSADIEVRLGPLMRELAGAGDAATRREALMTEVSRGCAQLLGDYCTAIEASLALSPETMQAPYFRDRVTWLAGRLERDYRTALRRIDEAEQRLAEVIATELRRRRGRVAVSPDGWYIEELRTLLRLDGAAIESREDRHIVSTTENLTEVMAWYDVPRGADQPGPVLQAEILYGGLLVRKEQPARNRFHLMVQLPAPLQPGQEHEYGLVWRMPRDMLRRPHYLLTPECLCNSFDLRVRFDVNRLPGWIRRVDGETVRTFEDAQPTGDLLVPDAAGEVRERFRDLHMYLGYGIQWQPAAGRAGPPG